MVANLYRDRLARPLSAAGKLLLAIGRVPVRPERVLPFVQLNLSAWFLVGGIGHLTGWYVLTGFEHFLLNPLETGVLCCGLVAAFAISLGMINRRPGAWTAEFYLLALVAVAMGERHRPWSSTWGLFAVLGASGACRMYSLRLDPDSRKAKMP